ncbi:MAG: aryl-sulfate sulfotransferase [Rectinemataceae bacterium]|nr:aryl-sulfate sulfotransferase [Rectinemataceae bacterium]
MAVILLGGVVYLKYQKKDDSVSVSIRIVLFQLAKQKITDEKLHAELYSGIHSFEHPLVILDPYGVSPLTAVILFETKNPSRISISIKGKDPLCGVMHSFSEFRTKHLIPVYGLYADIENKILLEATEKTGGLKKNHLIILTDRPHPKFENIKIDILKSENSETQSGFTFLYKHTPKFAFDTNGDIRWFLDLPTLQSVLYNYNGHLFVASGSLVHGDTLLYEIDLLGRIYSISSTQYGVHHDIEEIGNGKLIITGSDAGTTIEDILYELDPSTGIVDTIIDFKKILDPERLSMYRTDDNWLHMNAAIWSKVDNSIIISGRRQSAIVKIHYPDGGIKWILGNHDNWLPEYVKFLLTPVGKDFEWPFAQHSPTILPDQDNNPDTVDIILFDNHSFMETQKIETFPEPRYSRLVQYRIDEKAMTIEQIWQFGKEHGNDLFVEACGVADYLQNGNVLGYFCLNLGHRSAYSRIIELKNGTRNVVFDAIVYYKDRDSFIDYRATRRQFYSSVDNNFYKLEPCMENLTQNLRRYATTP